MTQKLLLATAMASLILVGCGQPAPDDGKNITDADHIQGDTVSIILQ